MLAEALSADDTRGLIELLSEHGIPALVPLARGVDGFPPPRVEPVGRAQYLVYQRRRPSVPSLVVKTIGDRLLAALLLVLLSPLLLLLVVAARLFVGRPLLYVQRRGGLYGRPFKMLKFRTMQVGAEEQRAALLAQNEMDGPVFKLTNDPRVTTFGRLLRRFSLDELPQLINVLAGQMSLVGPRPLPVEETAALTGGHRRRLSMRPGSDLPLAGGRAQRAAVQGVDGARSRLRRSLEPGARSGDPAPDPPGDCQGARGALRRASSKDSTRAPKRRFEGGAIEPPGRRPQPRRIERQLLQAIERRVERLRRRLGEEDARSRRRARSRARPPPPKATTGRPAASASTGTMPKSSSAGWTTARQPA